MAADDLRHHVHRRSHDLTRDSKPGWRRFGFPLMYQTDALEILLILTRLGREGEVAGASPDGAGGTPILGDERLREALDLVASRADAQGRWKLQQTFNGRFGRRHRDQGRAEPLGDPAGARGAARSWRLAPPFHSFARAAAAACERHPRAVGIGSPPPRSSSS